MTAHSSGALRIDYEDPEFQSHPWDLYRRFRAEEPVWWSEAHRCFFLFRHADITMAFRSPQFTAVHPFRRTRQLFGPTMIDVPDPLHANIRAVSVARMKSADLKVYLKDIIQPPIDDLLAPLLDQGPVDWIESFAKPLPMRVMCSLFGFPEDDSEPLYRDFRPIIRYLDSVGSLADADRARQELIASVRRRLENPQGRAYPGIAHLLAGSDDLDETTAMNNILMLIAAATETTILSLSNVLLCLDAHSFPWDTADPDCIRDAVRECLRWQPPLHSTVRFATEDVTLNGVTIPRGSAVQLCIASGNRDETVFEDSETWNPDRKKRTILTFGIGAHACIGQMLATFELEATLQKMCLNAQRPEIVSTTGTVGRVFRGPRVLELDLTSRGKSQDETSLKASQRVATPCSNRETGSPEKMSRSPFTVPGSTP